MPTREYCVMTRRLRMHINVAHQDELVEILSPLTRPPPGIESGLDTLCTQLHGLYAERLEAIQEVHEAVVTAFITWFDSDSSLDDQHATVEQMKAMRDRLSAQVARQKEVLISISVRAPSFIRRRITDLHVAHQLYQERTQHAPSSLNTSVGKRVDVSDLLKAMHDYDEAMKEISHVFDVCAQFSTDFALLMIDVKTTARASAAAEGEDFGAGDCCSTVRVRHQCPR